MIINAGPQMGYSELVELYGEELGFSIGKTLRKTKSAVKSVAKPIAKTVVKAAKVVARNPAAIATGGVSLLAPKSIQKKLNSAVRITSTGGASLLVSKQDRNAVGKVARATQAAVVRPVAHVAANAARSAGSSKLLKNAASMAVKSFVPGGAAALTALDATQSLVAKGRKKIAPMVAKNIPLPTAIRSAVGQVGQVRPSRSSFAPAPAAAAADAAPASSFPILPVAIGGAGLLLVAVMAMGKKK